MASLENASIASSYTSLLKLNGNTDNLVAGASGDAIQIVDGNGTGSSLYLNTDRIGIGTDSPDTPLTLGESGSPSAMKIFSATNGNPLLIYEDTDNSLLFNFFVSSADDAGLLMYGNGASAKIQLSTNGNSYFTGGNVGIGAAPTEAKLEIHGGNYNTSLLIKGGAGSTGIKFEDSDGTVDGYIYAAASSMGFLNASGEYIFKASADSRISLSNNDSSGEASSTLLGYQAGNAIASGAHKNLAIGHQALYQQDACDDSIAIGYLALSGTDSGTCNHNVAIGNQSLSANMTHVTKSTAIGSQALGSLAGASSPTQNIGIGYQAGLSITNSSNNIAIGANALGESGSNAITGAGNIAIGTASLYNQEGNATKNTAIGHNAGLSITTGNSCTILGYDSEPSAVGAVNQTVIGSEATGQADNSVVLGNASVDRVYAAQDGAAVLYANGTINTSDRRFKENIDDSDLGLEFINKIRTVSYTFIDDKQKDGKIKYGIIAQEVQEVLKESGNEDFAGIKDDNSEKLGADYVQFIAPLIKSVQELTARVKELESK